MASEQEDPVQAQREQQEQLQEETAAHNAAAAEDAQKDMVEQAKNAGVTAFSFDPDATPEQKRAQARAVSPIAAERPAPRRDPLLTPHPRRPCRRTSSGPMASRSSRTRTTGLLSPTCRRRLRPVCWISPRTRRASLSRVGWTRTATSGRRRGGRRASAGRMKNHMRWRVFWIIRRG